MIKLSSLAVARYIDEIEEILLVSASEEEVDGLPAELHAAEGIGTCRINCVRLPEIGYLDEATAAGMDPEALKSTLLRRFGGYVWWIHNHHIGKNPIFTKVLIDIAEGPENQPMIFHIHDFPECGRYPNLRFLKNHHQGTLYPIGSGVGYAVINTRDRDLLVHAGIPESKVHFLPNPQEPVKTAGEDPSRTERTAAFLQSLPGFLSDAPTMIYPVRCIRRKNVLEAGMLAILAEPEMNLLITLPGTSAQERDYSDLAAECFHRELVSGVFGAGLQAEQSGLDIGFQDLVAYADVVISTSIQEGFGYLFINSLEWRKRLIARNLEILSDFESHFDDHHQHVYNQFLIPADLIDIRDLAETYHRFIRSFSEDLGQPLIEELLTDFRRIFKADAVDFSYLGPKEQVRVLEKCKQAGIRDKLRKLNAPLLHTIEGFASAGTYTHSCDLEPNFGFQTYAERCKTLFQSVLSGAVPGTAPSAHAAIDENIRRYFVSTPYFRLLYAPILTDRAP